MLPKVASIDLSLLTNPPRGVHFIVDPKGSLAPTRNYKKPTAKRVYRRPQLRTEYPIVKRVSAAASREAPKAAKGRLKVIIPALAALAGGGLLGYYAIPKVRKRSRRR